MKEYEVGDRVWFVPDRGDPHYVAIVLVSRDWITLDGWRWRFSLDSKVVNQPGFGRVGQWFESQEEWVDDRARSALRLTIGVKLWELSLEDLEAIDRILDNAKT